MIPTSKLDKYILFAWKDELSHGGLNDNCGWFSTPSYALDFFLHGSHCANFDTYQIVDTKTFEIVSEGKR
jgi:hypothetical protein